MKAEKMIMTLASSKTTRSRRFNRVRVLSVWSFVFLSVLAASQAKAAATPTVKGAPFGSGIRAMGSELKSVRTIEGLDVKADETGRLIEETLYVMRDMIKVLLASEQPSPAKGMVKVKPNAKAVLDDFFKEAQPSQETLRSLHKSDGSRWHERALILAGVKLMNLKFQEGFAGSEGQVRSFLSAENPELNAGIRTLRSELNAQLRGSTLPLKSQPEILSAQEKGEGV